MKSIVCLFFCFFPFFSSAENLCSASESKGEGHWPILESAFNFENVQTAKKKLDALMKRIENSAKPLSIENSIGLYSEVKNQLIMIEGYILRAQAIDEKANKTSKASVKAWCTFLTQQAVVRH